MQKSDEIRNFPGTGAPASDGVNGRPVPPVPETAVPAEAIPRRAFGRRDWMLLGASLALAVLWSTVFWPQDLWWGHISDGVDLMLCLAGDACLTPLVPGMIDWHPFGFVLPGIGLTFVGLAVFACVLAALGRRARYDRTTIPLLAACALMCLFPTLFGNHVLRVLNCLVLWAVGSYTLFLVADLGPTSALSITVHLRAMRHFFASLVRFVPMPVIVVFDALRARKSSREGAVADRRVGGLVIQVGVGLLACALLLNVILPLLMSADEMFTTILIDAFERLFHMPDLGELPARILYALMVTPFLFSLMWGYSSDEGIGEGSKPRRARRRWLHTVTAAMVLCVLDLVYALFVAVQFVYLFGGVESAAMSGGYAEYARSGFFQLVAVTVINVIVSLVVVRFAEPRTASPSKGTQMPSRIVIWLVWALVAMTAVILVSAAWRMRLYVSAYGLTVLRCLTFLGMAFAAIVLVSLVVKTVSPAFHFYRALVVSGTALWIAFNMVNVDARIAEYNVSTYLDGTIEMLDVSYFWHLSPDAQPALEPLVPYLTTNDVDDLPDTWVGVLGEYEFLVGEEELALMRESRASAGEDLPWQLQCLPYWKARYRAGDDA